MNSVSNCSPDDELVLVNCFYYSFYIKKNELKKYKVPDDFNKNKYVTININDIEGPYGPYGPNGPNGPNGQVYNILNFSNILDKYKLLENLIYDKIRLMLDIDIDNISNVINIYIYN